VKTFVGQVHFQSTCPGATELKKYFSGPYNSSTGLVGYVKIYIVTDNIVEG